MRSQTIKRKMGKTHNKLYLEGKWKPPSLNPETSKKTGETLKKLYKEGKITSWNKGKSNKKQFFCVDCGKEITKNSKRCQKCVGKTRENENNVNWVGNKIKYKSLHYYLKNKKIKPKFCERCGQKPPYDIALKEGKKYTRNIDDYEWLCRRCHMVDDGRLEKVKQRCLEKKIEVNIELIKHKRFVEKKSQQKIADEMDIDRSIVRNRLKKLKDYECDVVKWSS